VLVHLAALVNALRALVAASPIATTAKLCPILRGARMKQRRLAQRSTMRHLRFSLHLYGDPTASARAVEEAGFDAAHFGEHLLFHAGGTMNGIVALSGAAAVTSRIRLISTITYVPLYRPAILAWLATSLDHLSKGRFEIGVGVGGEYPQAFELAGVALEERGAITDEVLEVVTRLWSEEEVTFEGRFSSFQHVRWSPKPIQKPFPIWVGGRKEPSMRRAARYGTGWLPYMYSPERLASSIATVRRYAEQFDRDPDAIRMGVLLFVTVGPDSATAKTVAAELVGAGYRRDVRHLVDRYLVAGTPDECRSRLRDYYDAGARFVFITLRAQRQEADEMMRLLVSDVLPEFQLGK